MKNKHLTLGKKTLSVFLAVLMLMTCWVFVPGDHNHAQAALADTSSLDEAIAAYESKMDGTIYTNMMQAYYDYITALEVRDAYKYGGDLNPNVNLALAETNLEASTAAMTAWSPSNNYTKMAPSFAANTGTQPTDSYGNIVYTQQTLTSDTSSKEVASVNHRLYLAPTVLIVDGVNDAKMPIMYSGKKTNTSKTRYTYSVYPAAGDSNGSDHGVLDLIGYWHGGGGTTLDFSSSWGYTTYQMAYSYATGYNGISANSTSHRSKALVQTGATGSQDNNRDFHANVIKIDETALGSTKYVVYRSNDISTGTLTYFYYGSGNDANSDEGWHYIARPIGIINYKWFADQIDTDLLKKAKNIKQDSVDFYYYLQAVDALTSINLSNNSSGKTESAASFDALLSTLSTGYNYSPYSTSAYATADEAMAQMVGKVSADLDTIRVQMDNKKALVTTDPTTEYYSLLRTEITTSEAILVDSSEEVKYTTDSWSAFETAYANAQSFMATTEGKYYAEGTTAQTNYEALKTAREGLTLKTFTITWNNYDGTTITTSEVQYGSTPSYTGTTPTRTADEVDHYVFASWSPAIAAITGDTTYTATYTTAAHTWADTGCEEARVCSVCNATFDAPGHSYSDATCTTAKTCTECGATSGDPLGHSYSSVTTAPTCEEGGYTTYTCTVCGASYTGNETAALGHNYTNILTGSANYTDDTHTVRCSRYYSAGCGGETQLPHNFDTIVSTEGATCVIKGTVTEKCTCGKTRQVEGELAPDVHENTTTINVKDVTCTVDGYTGDTYCNDCQKTVKTGTTITQLGHSFTNYVYNNNATCFDNGTKTAKCDRCDVTDTQTAEGTQLTHKYTTYVYNNDAKCEENGTKTASCDHGCGTEDTIEAENTALEHNYTGDINDNGDGTHSYLCMNNCGKYGGAADCSDWVEDGDNCKCEDCGYTKSHAWGAWQENADNTALAAGKMTRTCSDCSAVETKGCTYTQTNYSAAACTSPERTTYTCSDCGHGYTVIGAAATGHDFSGGDVKTHNNGYHSYYCKNECGSYGDNTTVNAMVACSYGYTNTASGTHTAACTVCTYSYSENCSGGQATCTAPAECQYCEEAYGDTAPHSFTGTPVVLDGDKHAYRCENCDDQTIYGVDEKQNETEACSGGTATCTALAKCSVCEDTHGDKAPHSFTGTPVVLDGDEHAYRCEYCEDENISGVGEKQGDTEACSGGTATCTALAECSVCEDTHGELDADNHKWGTAAADTANEGKHIYTCEYNGDHTYSEACESGSYKVVAPKCEEQGYTIQTCKECSYEWNTDYTDATGHNWVDPVDNKNGTHTLTCDKENVDGWVCDETLTLNCADSAITYGYEPATCTEQGYTTYQCTVCSYTWNADYVDATGHSYAGQKKKTDDLYKRSDKDCTTALTYWYCCDNCNVSAGTEKDEYDDETVLYWVEKAAEGHKMDDIVDTNDLAKNRKSEATCTEAAVYYYSCSVCGEQDTTQTFTYKAALGHDYQDFVDTDDLTKNRKSEATCTSPAIYYKSCSRCDDVSTTATFEYGEAIGHKMTKTDAVAATCITAGNVEYYTCSNCNKTFSDEEGTKEITKTVLEALDHDWVKVEHKAATCEEDGHSAYEDCSRCDEIRNKITEGYEATGHNFTGGYYCDRVNNYHSKYCRNKDCTATGIVVDGVQVKYAVEYDGMDYVITGGEKCSFDSYTTVTDENGIHSHKLTCVCGNETSKAYSDEETFVETVAPTCTVDGYDSYKCPDCGDTWQKNIVTAPGHSLADSATSNGDDTHSVKCSKCDYAEALENCSGGTATCKDKAVCDVCKTGYGETTAHSYDETKWVYQNDETCTQDGTEKNTCTFEGCGYEATRTAENTATGHSMISEYVYDVSDWKKKPESFNEDIKAPTCKEEGLGIIYCVNCDYYKTKTVKADANAHEWKYDLDDTSSWEAVSGDCGTGVTLKNTCNICGAVKTTVVTGNHDWHPAFSYNPTCTQPGIVKEVCYVCQAEKVTTCDDDPALAPVEHTYGETVAVEANCTEAAHKEQTCSVCGYVNKFDFTGDIEHTFNKGVEYAATCETAGYTEYTCYECRFVEKIENAPAKGHNDGNDDGKCDECNNLMYDESDSTKGCGCICHKDNWLMRFVYKILNSFWKLFKISKSCECGFEHW